MRRVCAFLPCLLLAICSSTAYADFEEGLAAFEIGDYETAVKHWETAAAAGDVRAMNNLGFVYANGIHGKRDPAKAVSMYKLAVEKTSDPFAMANLGWAYLSGEGIAADVPRGIAMIKQAVEQHDVPWASLHLGLAYMVGRGVPRDQEKACRLFIRAADEVARAVGFAAVCTEEGVGTAKDLNAAKRLYRKAISELNDVGAMVNLARLMLESTDSAEYPRAIHLLRRAAEQQHPGAFALLGDVYLEGKGVPADPREAVHLYEQSLRTFDAKAQQSAFDESALALDDVTLVGRVRTNLEAARAKIAMGMRAPAEGTAAALADSTPFDPVTTRARSSEAEIPVHRTAAESTRLSDNSANETLTNETTQPATAVSPNRQDPLLLARGIVRTPAGEYLRVPATSLQYWQDDDEPEIPAPEASSERSRESTDRVRPVSIHTIGLRAARMFAWAIVGVLLAYAAARVISGRPFQNFQVAVAFLICWAFVTAMGVVFGSMLDSDPGRALLLIVAVTLAASVLLSLPPRPAAGVAKASRIPDAHGSVGASIEGRSSTDHSAQLVHAPEERTAEPEPEKFPMPLGRKIALIILFLLVLAGTAIATASPDVPILWLAPLLLAALFGAVYTRNPELDKFLDEAKKIEQQRDWTEP